MNPDPVEEYLRRDARIGLDRLVAQQIADVDPHAFETRPPWPLAEPGWGTSREPLPLPAITAARRVMLEARLLESETIAHARGRGHTWTEIADAIGALFVARARRRGRTPAEAAWRYAAYRVMPDEEVPWSPRWSDRNAGAHWRCWTCGENVAESHPDGGREAEVGHGAGCERDATVNDDLETALALGRETGALIGELQDRLRRQHEQIEAARGRHQPRNVGGEDVCIACGVRFPCGTVLDLA